MEQTLQLVGLERVLRYQNNCLNKLAGLVAPVMGSLKQEIGSGTLNKIGYFYEIFSLFDLLHC